MTVKYTDQTLVVPADVCKILERSNLLDCRCDDFGLNIEIENGKLKITDMLEYIVKEYRSLEPEEAWILVRKWWETTEKATEADREISVKEKQIEKLKAEIDQIQKTRKKWRLW